MDHVVLHTVGDVPDSGDLLLMLMRECSLLADVCMYSVVLRTVVDMLDADH